jgi:hypothetical protein
MLWKGDDMESNEIIEIHEKKSETVNEAIHGILRVGKATESAEAGRE